jgi:hypothetical protein
VATWGVWSACSSDHGGLFPGGPTQEPAQSLCPSLVAQTSPLVRV